MWLLPRGQTLPIFWLPICVSAGIFDFCIVTQPQVVFKTSQNLWPHIWIMKKFNFVLHMSDLLWPVKQFLELDVAKAAFLPFVYLTGNACVAAYFFRLCYIKVCRWQRSITCKIYELTFLQFTKVFLVDKYVSLWTRK